MKRGLFLWRKLMTKLPEKNLLDGSKSPKTTTGEMKDALGKLRDYLDDLLGEDSSDREAARRKLGVDLAELVGKIDAKAGRAELDRQRQALEEKIAERGVPVGSIDWFATPVPPVGYLKADGSAVGRETYPELFAAIGTAFGEGDGENTFNLPDLEENIPVGTILPFASHAMPPGFRLCDGAEVSRTGYAGLFAAIGTAYGEGDGSATFNLPNLIGRFAEGSATPGTVKEAGLPDIEGRTDGARSINSKGAFSNGEATSVVSAATGNQVSLVFKASDSNPVYGASDTVQPPALTVCYGIRVKNVLHAAVKAFDAALDPGMIDLTELANDVQRNRIPVGTLAWFAMSAPPPGYLVADGSAVARETYRKLFGAIGTTYGEGDGKTTFNLPDLMGRFAEGSATPGVIKEAGLPNIEGSLTDMCGSGASAVVTGALTRGVTRNNQWWAGATAVGRLFDIGADASLSNPVYGNSDTVQPPALTLLPCIKAFHA